MFDVEQQAYRSFRSIVRERTSPVIAWVGSGLSQPAGLPSWARLRAGLCDLLEERAGILDDPEESTRLQERAKRARSMENPWLAFQVLEKELGDTTFQSSIREALRPADSCRIPETYDSLWSLPLRGVLNVSLDRLATRACTARFPGAQLNEFTGEKAGAFTHILKDPYPFIANLHGTLADAETWVFTHERLKRLVSDRAYSQFLWSCLTTSTVLFLGITADDVAVGGHLRGLKDLGVDFGAHYWLTDRDDRATFSWAERSGVRIITYSKHQDLRECFSDLLSYIPRDGDPSPITMAVGVGGRPELPSPEEILDREPEEIRDVLNRNATYILTERTADAYRRYDEFRKTYGRAIHHAWYVECGAHDNKLFGFELREEVAEGAFARVFSAVAPEGERVAIKLLKEDVMRKPEMLRAFRRGVESMRILAHHQLRGMVEYRKASEIPASVVMEYVQGPNLRQAVVSSFLQDWGTVIRIATDLALIVRSAHALPERVLHRDLRPTNIMLKDYYPGAEPDEWKVVVLDFDLSWHRGAIEDSVLGTSTYNGYLAPEQIERRPSAYTRNALVDSFGLGMTLFFMRTGKEPVVMEHRHTTWTETLQRTIGEYPCSEWNSLPRRYARLIERCTRDDQARRWDMAQVCSELERLSEALRDPSRVQSAELWAEEFAARVECLRRAGGTYKWDPDIRTAVFDFAGGLEVRLRGREIERKVESIIAWVSRGEAKYKSLAKYVPVRCQEAIDALKVGGWRFPEPPQISPTVVNCRAEIPVMSLSSNAERAIHGLVDALDKLSFT